MKHLSYRQFKNIFGDLGVTAWTKFNWLSNGLPDGEYNGIKKVTFTMVKSINHNCRALIATTPFIPAVSGSTSWAYGLSNYEIESANATYTGVNKTCVSVDGGSAAFVRVPTIEQTVEAYNAYLKEHPLIIYYYDKNEWGGVIVSSMQQYQNYCLYSSSKGLDLITGIKDVNGEYAFIGSVDGTPASFNTPDKTIATNEIAHQNIIWQDYDYKPYSNNLTDFITDKLPRAIVYKLTATQSLSMQSEDESQEIDSDVVVI